MGDGVRCASLHRVGGLKFDEVLGMLSRHKVLWFYILFITEVYSKLL